MIWLLLTIPGLLLGLGTIAALVQANRCDAEAERQHTPEADPSPLRLVGAGPSLRVY